MSFYLSSGGSKVDHLKPLKITIFAILCTRCIENLGKRKTPRSLDFQGFSRGFNIGGA